MPLPLSRGSGDLSARLTIELARLALDVIALGLDVLTCKAIGHEIVWRQTTTMGQRPFCGRCRSQLR